LSFFKNITILKSVLLTILYILFIEVIGAWIFLADALGIKNADSYYSFVNGIIQFSLILIFLKAFKISDFKLPQKTNYKWYILAFILGSFFTYIQTPLNWFYNIIAGSEYHIIYDFNGLSKFKNLNIISFIFLIPISEEFFFREFIQKNFQNYLKPISAILVSTILFTSIHLPYEAIYFSDIVPSFHSAYIAFFGSLISGGLYFKSKSIGPSIVMHVMWNLIVILT